jgi:plastocyanin domain-containing protein
MSWLLRSVEHNIHGRHEGTVAAREVGVRVRGGYDPDTIRAVAGVPLRIVFRREESSACSEQVVFPALGKSATLPEGESVVVEVLATEPGEYEFTCAMGMLRGRLVVSPHEESHLSQGRPQAPVLPHSVQSQFGEKAVGGGGRR